MTGAMFKKEWKESIRRYRLVVIVGVLLLIGVISPVSAKLLPKMMEMLATQANTQGFEFTYDKEPTPQDALIQYNKNLGLLPLLIAIMGMGLVAEEKIRGTAETVLTKPVSRFSLFLAKFSVFSLITFLAVVTGGGVCFFYATILLGPLDWGRFLFFNFLILFYFIPYIAIILFLSVAIKSMAGAAAAGIGAYFSFMIMAGFPWIGKFTPQGLYSYTSKMSAGMAAPDWFTPFVSSLCITILFFLLSKIVFEKQEI
ncbi:MAG: ABC transporter permease subunit [Candidatus Aminicenantes bacterium]|nr:ABC transporter permease subunit [Candidatus Aminicenantes bacterium]